MNKNQLLDLLRINDALLLMTTITRMAEMDKDISLGGLSCLMWLCQNKLDQIVDQLEEQIEAKQPLIITP